ncbi:MAG: extracellular solute-binding protein [Planctomycetota bacterium]|nr:extracellular solute-binding protein [Planctomycetota bacterium]
MRERHGPRTMVAYVYQDSLPSMQPILDEMRRAHPEYAWRAEHRAISQQFKSMAGEFRQPWTSTCLFPMTYRALPALARGGYLTPLDGAFPARAITAFEPRALALASYKDQLFGMPEDLSPYALIARRDLLDRLNLDVPDTWDEFERQLPLLAKLCGGRPVCVDLLGTSWDQGLGFLSSLLSTHGAPLGPVSESLAAAPKVWKAAYEFARGLHRHFGWLDPRGAGLASFPHGRAAYCFAFPGGLARLPREALGRLAVAPVPRGTAERLRTVFCKGTCWCVPRGTLAPDLAVELLKAVTDPARAKAMELAQGCAFPARHGLWRDAEVLARKPFYARAGAFLEAHTCRPLPAGIDWDLAWSSFREALDLGESAEAWVERVAAACGTLARQDVRNRKIRDAICYAEANLSRIRRVADVAGYVGLHPRYFGLLFQKETGLSFPVWLLRARMEKARERLADLSKTTKELALSLGFRNSSVFCQAFKRHFRMNPTEMRRRLLSGLPPGGGL